MRVKVSETYDLCTTSEKMTLIGIHTPDVNIVSRHWSGLLQNFKKWRPSVCNVTIACASMLPADPLQVGVEAGDIAPEDMFNPILYKAVTNDSFETVVNNCYHPDESYSPSGESVLGHAADVTYDTDVLDSSAYDDFDAYYGILSIPNGWRKALPQQGLRMTGLRPLVHEIVFMYGNVGGYTSTSVDREFNTELSAPVVEVDGTYYGQGVYENVSQLTGDSSSNYPSQVDFATRGIIKGRAKRFPFIPTKHVNDGEVSTMPFPKTYVAAIVMPPSRLHQLYYRMKVEWFIDFAEPWSVANYATPYVLGADGHYLRFTNYDITESTTSKVTTSAMLDTVSASVEKVMDGAS
ncbi:capsid protein [Lynx rufus smacovirus 2]|uniref:Capsid protein n=1 Tax=Lynx rufus smacovirus 2 TaxID=2592415 RepID=A0A513ZT27_9VIRU|nr:capsid protein [Lynx rufus smacovirus 2]QDH43741.1 capsid protein [Lynx rufus smacovirus 2]